MLVWHSEGREREREREREEKEEYNKTKEVRQEEKNIVKGHDKETIRKVKRRWGPNEKESEKK